MASMSGPLWGGGDLFGHRIEQPPPDTSGYDPYNNFPDNTLSPTGLPYNPNEFERIGGPQPFTGSPGSSGPVQPPNTGSSASTYSAPSTSASTATHTFPGQTMVEDPVWAKYNPYPGQRIIAPENLSAATRSSEAGLAGLQPFLNQYGEIADYGPLGPAARSTGYAADQLPGIWGRLLQMDDSLRGQSGGDSSRYRPNQFSYLNVEPGKMDMNLNDYRVQSPEELTTGSFTDPGVAQSYMSPYMSAVTQARQADAQRRFDESGASRNAAAVRAGAFGGDRRFVQDSLANRDFSREMENISATGLQGAFENAQGQYERDRAAQTGTGMFNRQLAQQAALANQQAGMGTQALGLGSLLQGRGQDLQALLANQGADISAQSLSDQAGRAAEGLRLQGASTYGGLRQAGLDAAMRGAGLQSTLGLNQADLQRLAQTMELQRLQEQGRVGGTQDARTQSMLDLDYQNFMNQQNWPFQLANFYRGALSGVPVSVNQEQVQFQRINPAAQYGGLAVAGLGALSSYLGNRTSGGGNGDFGGEVRH